jgi:uncharacterized membrane protein
MHVEQASPVAIEIPAKRSPGLPEPPSWLIAGLAAAYVLALAALAFLPGATLVQRLSILDGGVCNQLVEHSYFPAGQQLPLCARCTGMYMGFAAATLWMWGAGRLRAASFPGRGVVLILGLAVVVMGVDGFNSLFTDLHLPHLYQPQNTLRIATGLGTGVAMAAFIIPVANTLLWRSEDTRSSFATPRQLAALLPILLLMFVGVVSQAAFLLYPVALLSSAGLVLAFSLVNLVFVLGIGNRVGRFTTWRQLFPVYTVVVILAVIELLALYVLKTTTMHALSLSAA